MQLSLLVAYCCMVIVSIFLLSYFKNMFRLGMCGPYFLRSFSNKVMVSFENPCPFHVLVLVISTQHSPSLYRSTIADVPTSEPVRTHGPRRGV